MDMRLLSDRACYLELTEEVLAGILSGTLVVQENVIEEVTCAFDFERRVLMVRVYSQHFDRVDSGERLPVFHLTLESA